MNVFQKCLRRQMGNQVYHSFYKKCAEKFSQSNLSQLNTNDGHLHDALYECIKKDDFEGLEEKKRDISETLRTAVRITKYFGLVILAYLFGNIILLALDLDYYVTCVSILLMGICTCDIRCAEQTLSRCAGYYTCPFGMGTGYVLPGLFRDGYSCWTVYQ